MTVINIEKNGNVGLIKIDYPPVNAAGFKVRSGLMQAVSELDQDRDIAAIALYAAGRTFVAGADIREFGKPSQPPVLPDVINTIENLEKPVIACIHGTALGGGLEIALGCHYRVIIESGKVGLPEVTLGILPGAGGTQRTPRLIGIEAALEMIVYGSPVSSKRALELGLVDKVSREQDPRQVALEFAKEIIASGAKVRRTCDIADKLVNNPENISAISRYRDKLVGSSKHLFSPHKCVEAIEACLELPFEQGLKKERALFLECMESPQRQGLIHAFFAQRKAAKIPESSIAHPRDIENVCVIGGGTMGAGITASLLFGGLTVTMIERDQDCADRGKANVNRILKGAVERGKLDQANYAEILAHRFSTAADYHPASSADLAIEAVFENLELKQKVFAALDKEMPPGAIMATNTSYLDINQIAAATDRPADVIGLHFFSPAHIMKLLEIVVPDTTSPDVTATAFALAKRLGKVAVRAGICDGFIGNRIMAAYRKAADYMVEDGASPYQVDTVLREFGFAMGPYQTADLAGLDIGWANRKRLAPSRPPEERYVNIADQICELGWLGRKTGRGYYRYEEDPKGLPDPEIEQLISDARSAKGIHARRFDNDEIVSRYLAAMINEASKVVEEGIALRPLDVDITLLFGYGFPRWRGGPMKFADMQGVDSILKQIEQYRLEDGYFWKPADLLIELSAHQSSFEQLNNSD
ncbi:MAG: 3-hydroxyacyl-CoA dehydrogenase NAD-binding domain-containing protein [Arenicellales bacterium]